MTATVGIVVLNWNGGEQTIACLESLRSQEYPHKFIVLVDNQSQADERTHLLGRHARDTDVHCVFLDENRGYAGGNNAGIQVALSRGADLVLVVTQDVTFASGALAALVAAAEESDIGIVGPKVVDARCPQRILSVGERVYVPLLCVPRTWLRYRGSRAKPYAVGGVLGCVMLLSASCLRATGGFDEDMFAYYEEVDLCLRARQAGFRLLCAPHAVVAHDGMRGFASGFTALSAELKARNLIRLMRRWARPADWLLLLPTYAVLLAASMGLYAFRGRWDIVASLWRGIQSGLQNRSGGPRTSGFGLQGRPPASKPEV